MQIRRSMAGAVIATGLGMVAALALSGPAEAASRNVSQRPLDADCNNSPYLLCLHFSGNETGAIWGTNSEDANLGDNRFLSPGAGAGQIVRNNAASMSCDTAALWCYSYFSPNFGGNVDYVTPQRSGNLFYTWNDEASVRLA